MTGAFQASGLDRLARVAHDLGATEIAADASALAERIAAGRFYVACVGQFKRGKSTLINVLVGRDVLPTGVLPVTTVVTVLREGPRLAARVRFTDGRVEEIDPEALAGFVTEDENPDNAKQVAVVEIALPSPLLHSGMCLVDTPGLGSVFEANTAATEGFVPHIDAAIVVLGGDPPLSHDELVLVGELAGQDTELLFVLNEADRLTTAERDQARGFAERMIAQRVGRASGPVWLVSATEARSGAEDRRDWQRLVESLERLARESGGHLVRAAEYRGARRIASRILYEIDEQQRALSRPVEESRRRVERLRACVLEAERSLNDLGPLFSAEQDRLFRRFEGRQREFLARAVPSAREELGGALRASGFRRGWPLRRRGLELAREIFERLVTTWRQEEQPVAEQLYRDATQRFVEVGNGFLRRLAEADDTVFGGLPRELAPEIGFRVRDPFYATSLMSLTGQSVATWMADLFRTRSVALSAAERVADKYLRHLLETNASRVIAALKDQVVESRRGLEADLRVHIRSIGQTAERAFDRVRAAAEAGGGAIETEPARLAGLRREVEALSAALPEIGS